MTNCLVRLKSNIDCITSYKTNEIKILTDLHEIYSSYPSDSLDILTFPKFHSSILVTNNDINFKELFNKSNDLFDQNIIIPTVSDQFSNFTKDNNFTTNVNLNNNFKIFRRRSRAYDRHSKYNFGISDKLASLLAHKESLDELSNNISLGLETQRISSILRSIFTDRQTQQTSSHFYVSVNHINIGASSAACSSDDVDNIFCKNVNFATNNFLSSSFFEFSSNINQYFKPSFVSISHDFELHDNFSNDQIDNLSSSSNVVGHFERTLNIGTKTKNESVLSKYIEDSNHDDFFAENQCFINFEQPQTEKDTHLIQTESSKPAYGTALLSYEITDNKSLIEGKCEPPEKKSETTKTQDMILGKNYSIYHKCNYKINDALQIKETSETFRNVQNLNVNRPKRSYVQYSGGLALFRKHKNSYETDEKSFITNKQLAVAQKEHIYNKKIKLKYISNEINTEDTVNNFSVENEDRHSSESNVSKFVQQLINETCKSNNILHGHNNISVDKKIPSTFLPHSDYDYKINTSEDSKLFAFDNRTSEMDNEVHVLKDFYDNVPLIASKPANSNKVFTCRTS